MKQTLALISLLVIIPVAWCVPTAWGWFLVAVCMVVFVLIMGALVTKRPLGLLINERNLMSLSRFQTALWTMIVLSAYFMIAIAHVKAAYGNNGTLNGDLLSKALDVEVDWRLWAIMGISLTSLVGTSLISSTKTQKNPDPAEVKKTAQVMAATGNLPNSIVRAASDAAKSAAAKANASPQLQDLNPAEKDNVVQQAAEEAKTETAKKAVEENKQGTLYSNPSINDAAFSDMFEGDEVGNAAYLDLAKVQMFYFTIIIVLTYMVQLWSEMGKLNGSAQLVTKLPELSQGMIALLGISHAGHLAGKGVDRTKQS